SALSRPPRRALNTRFAPPPANSRASAAPMPALAPVTSAHLPRHGSIVASSEDCTGCDGPEARAPEDFVASIAARGVAYPLHPVRLGRSEAAAIPRSCLRALLSATHLAPALRRLAHGEEKRHALESGVRS